MTRAWYGRLPHYDVKAIILNSLVAVSKGKIGS